MMPLCRTFALFVSSNDGLRLYSPASARLGEFSICTVATCSVCLTIKTGTPPPLADTSGHGAANMDRRRSPPPPPPPGGGRLTNHPGSSRKGLSKLHDAQLKPSNAVFNLVMIN